MSHSEDFALPRWKRTLDMTAVVIAMPLILPLAAMIIALIRSVSAGPILFQQERVGYRGRRFMCLKFRTMHCGAESVPHEGHLHQLMKENVPLTKMDAIGDSRIIPLGQWLRASGLDELPQLVNVLRGEMSLVGPRPCMAYEAARYLPWQMERFNAVPGLTGLWQVNGKNRTTFTRMIQYDIEYARTKTVWLDVKIIFKTVPALVIQIRDLRLRRKAVAGGPAAGQNPIPLRVANR